MSSRTASQKEEEKRSILKQCTFGIASYYGTNMLHTIRCEAVRNSTWVGSLDGDNFLQWDTMLSSVLLLYSIFDFYRRLFIDLDVFHVFVSIQVSRRKVLIEKRGRD
jgi:hypothetical protein